MRKIINLLIKNGPHQRFDRARLLIMLRHMILMILDSPAKLFGTRRKPYLELLYKIVLKRDADSSGLDHWASVDVEQTTFSWKIERYKDFTESPEYLQKFGIGDFNVAHHLARCLWIKKIPAAKSILDLGGSSSFDEDGALLAMGYPHKPERITIIDFPPENRQASSFSELAETDHISKKNGAKIEFIYDSFVNLQRFGDQSYDLIVAGQVIEHVTRDDAIKVFRESLRILKPGGKMFLDTPNRGITKLLGDGFIHPEHKIEYYPKDLIKLAAQSGFLLLEQGAISPMPKSAQSNRVDFIELCENIELSDRPEIGYSFYLTLEKPAE